MDWWKKKPRIINIIVDNDSWILGYAKEFFRDIEKWGDRPYFYRHASEVQAGDLSFYLGCVNIVPAEILNKSKKNLVVHESDLPKGRGFSPLTWQVLENINKIPVTLLEMTAEVDAGPIIYQDHLLFEGHELIDELREALGQKTIELGLNYIQSDELPKGRPQEGVPSVYPRRSPKDSRLDPSRSIDQLFNLLRVVDNERYPAFFEKCGFKYCLKIEKI